jgi:hypothetical protein
MGKELTPCPSGCPSGNLVTLLWSVRWRTEQWVRPGLPSILNVLSLQEAMMAFDLGNLLQQYLGGAQNANTAQAANDFEQAAQAAPRETVAQGVTQALRSDQTPPFPQMVSHLFGQSNPEQRAGMLNQILASVGPQVMSSLGGGVLGNLFGGGQAPTQVTPEQAAQVSPEQMQEIAAKAEQHNPGIVDKMGDFYSQHPGLVKAIGGAALAIVLGHMAQQHQRQ